MRISNVLLSAILSAALIFTGCGTTAENQKESETSPVTETTESVSDSETETKAETEESTVKRPERPVFTKDDKIIALTFDDGPNLTTTNAVLDKLEEYGAVGSFFLIGDNITGDENQGTARSALRAYNMGCEINSHSKTHSDMTKLTPEEIKAEMEFTAEKIKEITGEYPAFFRPPYISVNQTMFDNIDLPFICGFGCNDWEEDVTAEQRAEKVLSHAKDGAIILLHDMQGNTATVEALDTIIPALQKDGYQFVTVSELFAAKEITPQSGIVYSYAEQTK